MENLIFDSTNINWENVNKIFAPEKESFLQSAKKKFEKYPLTKDTLLILAGFGLVSMAVIMPGIAAVVAKEIRNSERGKFKQRLNRMKQQKLIEIKGNPDGMMTVEITQEGLKRALKYKLETMKIKTPGKWDKLWRVVIFDVPENKRVMRDRFRNYLKSLGFYMLNKSVFVHPYPCFDEVEFLRHVSGVGAEVTYIVAKSVESSANLKDYFDLT